MSNVTPATVNQLNYDRIYAYRFRDVDQLAKVKAWEVIGSYLYGRLGSPSSVLDPAAGNCEFVNAIPAKDVWAVDLASDLSKIAKPHIKTLQSNIFSADLPANHFEAAFVSNFLEHLNSHEEVGAFLQIILRTLRPGGNLCILGPNFKYCFKEYFDCADHKLALTHMAVCEHLYGAGFDVAAVHPKFLPFSFRSKLPPNPTLLASYLRLPLAWKILGKQFLIFATKRR